MPIADFNFLAVLACGVAAFVLGGLWYSPIMFGKRWMALSGVSEEQARSGNPWRLFGGAFVLALIGAVVFAMFLGPRPALPMAVGAGFMAGFFWVAGSLGINYLFERKPLGLWLINGGYHTLQYTVYGLILGLWK
ncbi:MAG: DUF1761 domain-containing protein [Gammaproteobacteria bacterium]|jgi:hypothetical protein